MSWRQNAACIPESTDTFFPTDDNEWSRMAAVSICSRCPVRGACLDEALADRALMGIWGGTSERQRRSIRRRAKYKRERAS